MKYQLLVILVLIFGAYSLGCGGNCPSNTCSSCWCGQTANKINIAQECVKYNWSQSCCRCIIIQLSGGNTNYMSQLDTNPKNGPLTGLWQLGDLVRSVTCKLQSKVNLCDLKANMDCAYKLLQVNSGKWDRIWNKAAAACGCGSKTQEE